MESWKEDEGETHDGSNRLVLGKTTSNKRKIQHTSKSSERNRFYKRLGFRFSKFQFFFRQDQREVSNVAGNF